jgi:hypothetical protein
VFQLPQCHIGLATAVVALDIGLIKLDALARIKEGNSIVLHAKVSQCTVAVVNCLLLVWNFAEDGFSVLINSLVKFAF